MHPLVIAALLAGAGTIGGAAEAAACPAAIDRELCRSTGLQLTGPCRGQHLVHALKAGHVQTALDRRPEHSDRDDRDWPRDRRRDWRSPENEGRRMRREGHSIHHGGHEGRSWARDWRDFNPGDGRSWRGHDWRWSHGHRTDRDMPRRDYGGGDIDGPSRGLGLPYWAPD